MQLLQIISKTDKYLKCIWPIIYRIILMMNKLFKTIWYFNDDIISRNIVFDDTEACH